MKYFLDTEFAEDGHLINLISVGMVAEDGRLYYAEVDPLPVYVNEWVEANVMPHLARVAAVTRTRRQIREELIDFTSPPFDHTPPEFWGRYCDYDWVVICQLFGAMIKLPEHWPKFCLDLKQEELALGNPPLPEQDWGTYGAEHNALADAKWNRDVWLQLQLVMANRALQRKAGRRLYEAANPD